MNSRPTGREFLFYGPVLECVALIVSGVMAEATTAESWRFVVKLELESGSGRAAEAAVSSSLVSVLGPLESLLKPPQQNLGGSLSNLN